MRSRQYRRAPSALSSRRTGSAARLAVLVVGLCGAAANAQTAFVDVSTEVGFDGTVFSSPTEHSLGVNWIDVNRDAIPDLFVVNGIDRQAKLYLNRGDGTFFDGTGFLPDLPNVDMTGSVFADYDNDGDSDIYIFTDNDDWNMLGENVGDGPPNLLLKNLWVENGGPPAGPDGRMFVEAAAEAGLEDLADEPFGELPGLRAKAGGWLDFDVDGCVDLFVGHLVFGQGGAFENRDRLYKNLCDGTFIDVTATSGMYEGDELESTTYRPTLAWVSGHFNDDTLPDMYLVNATPGVPGISIPEGHLDRLFLNAGDGSFVEIDQPEIGDDAQAGMGIDFADIERDGDFDLYISDLFTHNNELEAGVGNPLYRSVEEGYADNSAFEAGIEADDSWGVNFFDGDHDGWEDLFVGTFSTVEGLSLYYRNEGTGVFEDLSANAGLFTGSVRGSATADYDLDGDLDLAVVNQDGTLQLFRNDITKTGGFVQFRLTGVSSNADAIGALVVIDTADGRQMRQVKGGSSAHSQDSLHAHFGLGDATGIRGVRVLWPGGDTDRFEGAQINRRYDLIQGVGLVPLP